MSQWFEYMVLGLALATPFGPVNLEMIKVGMKQGFLSSWVIGMGDVLSNVLLVFSIYAFLSYWLHMTWFHSLLSIIGGVFMIGLSLSSIKKIRITWLASFPILSLLSRGFFLGLVNPMDSLSWLGVIGASGNQSPTQLTIRFFWMLFGISIWNTGLSLSASVFRRGVQPLYMERILLITNIALLCYGLYFVWNGIQPLFLPPN